MDNILGPYLPGNITRQRNQNKTCHQFKHKESLIFHDSRYYQY